MSFWNLNPGDPIADATRPGWARTGEGMGVQTAAPTFLQLTTGPIPRTPFDDHISGTFLLSRERTISAGLFLPPDARTAKFNYDDQDWAEWVQIGIVDEGVIPDRWHIVCRSLWSVDDDATPFRPRAWWAFWGQWTALGFLTNPIFAYGSNLEPDADDWNPSFGGRMMETTTTRAAAYGVPKWVDVVPWFP